MKVVIREAGACSDVGQLRQSNEDALLLADPVFAVADGMGGARAGEVASAMAVAALHGFNGGEQELARTIEDVNLRIHTASRNDASLLGMGTTITAAMIDGEATVKTFKRTAGQVWLMPHNPAFDPIPGNEAAILGKVVTVIRKI